MSEAVTPNPPAPALTIGVFHWILTAQTSDGRIVTHSGTVRPNPGATRSVLFVGATQQVANALGDSDFVVLFFSLEPEQLGREASR